MHVPFPRLASLLPALMLTSTSLAAAPDPSDWEAVLDEAPLARLQFGCLTGVVAVTGDGIVEVDAGFRQGLAVIARGEAHQRIPARLQGVGEGR